LLGRAGREDQAAVVERERVRLTSALSSLARLGLEDPRVAPRLEAFDAFVERELPRLPGAVAPPPSPPSATRRPVRRQAAPLDGMRRLVAGYERLSREERERLWAFERDLG